MNVLNFLEQPNVASMINDHRLGTTISGLEVEETGE
jgi:hypothetical protein